MCNCRHMIQCSEYRGPILQKLLVSGEEKQQRAAFPSLLTAQCTGHKVNVTQLQGANHHPCPRLFQSARAVALPSPAHSRARHRPAGARHMMAGTELTQTSLLSLLVSFSQVPSVLPHTHLARAEELPTNPQLCLWSCIL